ncbi:endonuclease V [Candidatus Bathyarchaeota archaeon]|nr:endonuclease V [Candidatus Bathyarchaeota archaeon]
MKKIPKNFDIKRARGIQSALAKRVIKKDVLPSSLKTIAGVDVSYTQNLAVAAVAILDYDNLETIEVQFSLVKICFPYVPTLLSFREAPAILSVLKKLKSKPDVCLIDGHGVAHPYRYGLACHIGVIKKVPTIGVAKNKLFGEVSKFERNTAKIKDNSEVIGLALLKSTCRRPLYISVGNMVSLDKALEIVKHCISNNYRTAIPIMIAHKLANRKKHNLVKRIKK